MEMSEADFFPTCTHTQANTDYGLSFAHAHDGSGVEAQISAFPLCSLTRLWSGIDASFLLTTSQSQREEEEEEDEEEEEEEEELQRPENRRKPKCELKLQSSTKRLNLMKLESL